MSNESYKSEISATQLARAHMGDRMFGANPHSEYEERIAELEAQSAAWREAARELSESHTQVVAERNALATQLEVARLLIVAIDENIWLGSENINCMGRNPLTIATRRIVELLRDPASNPWAALMRAGKEER